MYVNAKKTAVAGLLAAFTVVMLMLSSAIESSTLFFIAAASFCVGIVIREWGIGFGAVFHVAAIILNLLVAPNKMYVVTFTGMGMYIVLSEWLWKKIADVEVMQYRTAKLWIGKYIIFNMMYIPMLLFFPSIFLTKEAAEKLTLIFWIVGQAALWVYDRAYIYFQGAIWSKLRVKIMN